MTDVVEINRLEELDVYTDDWGRLYRETPDASFFQSLAWLKTYWRHFGGFQRLRVLVIGAARPTAIVPLTVLCEPTRIGRLRMLTWPLDEWGSFYGPLGSDPAAALSAAMLHLRQTPRDWDLIDFRWVPPDNEARSAYRSAMREAGLPGRESLWTQAAIVDLNGSWEDYLATRPAKFRSELRRQHRRAAEHGPLCYERFRPGGADCHDDAPCLPVYEQCVELARRSWQGSSQSGTTLSHQPVRGFLREVHVAAASAGAVDLNVLRIGDRLAAFACNYVQSGRIYGLRAGFDPEFAEAGAGTVLLSHMIRDSFQRGDRLIDLGTGYLAGKRPWMTRLVDVGRITHYAASSLRAQILRLAHRLRGTRRPHFLPA